MSRRVGRFAKPPFLLSTVGWFLLAVLGQGAKIQEAWGLALPQFCLGAGIMLYIIIIVALFDGQRMDMGNPALFLIIAPPSVAVVALDLFDDDGQEFSLAASLVLGWCLVVVLLLFRLGPTIAKKPPSLGTYWAYVFPLSGLATAILQYANTQQSYAANVMAIIFLCLAVLALAIVCLRFLIHSCSVMLGRDYWADPLLLQEGTSMMDGEHDDMQEKHENLMRDGYQERITC